MRLQDEIHELKTSSRGRLEELKGQLPHLSCRLREYSSAQLRQCVLNRRRHGKATKALFIGDSRIRQMVEVFMDVFRDLKFQVSTFEGISIGVDDFLSEDADFLWTKYKREFEARSTKLPDLSVGFYWTSLMGVKTKLPFLEPKENPELFSSTYKRFQERLGHRKLPFNLKTTLLNRFRNISNEDTQHVTVSSATFMSPRTEASSKMPTHIESSNHHQPQLDSRSEVVARNNQEPKVFKSEPIERLRNISRMAKKEVPDIIFLGTGVWSLNHQYGFLKVLDEVTLDQIELLRPVLREVARKTDTVWVMAPPISDNVFYKPTVGTTLRSNVFNKYQEWITSAQTQAFSSEGIPVWDSLQPVAEASIRDCSALNSSTELPAHPRLLHRRSWDCGDRVHTNNEAVVVAVEMIVNYLCNEYLPPEDYCCHQSP